MKSFFDYSKNEFLEEPKGSSKIIIGKPNFGDKFILVNNRFDLSAGSIVEITEETGKEYNVGFGLSSVNLKTDKGIITLKGSTKQIQELFNNYIESEIEEKKEPKVIVVNKTIQQKIIEEGTPGLRGTAGERGPMGPVGFAGPKGDKGDRGEKGDPGERGEQGVLGPKGDQGIPGTNGKDGKDGKDGMPGPVGPKGDRGEPGPEGKPGPAGAAGRNGKDGQRGEKGDKGDPGKDGNIGPEGKQGSPGKDGKDGKTGKQGPAGKKGEKGDKGDPGETGIVKVSHPLVYDAKTKHLSFDSKKIEKLVEKLSSLKSGSFDLTSIGGGAVGIQFNKAQIIKSVNDINFTGSGVTVTRKGKNVEVNITGDGGGGGGISGPYVVSLTGKTGAIDLRGARGITYTISGSTHSFGIDYSRGGVTFPIRNANSIDKIDVILLQDRDLIDNPKANEMYLVTMADMLDYFNSATPPATSFKSSTSILVTDSDDNLTKQLDYNTFISTISDEVGIKFTYATTAPIGATLGDRWMDSDNGIEYIYINDGNSNQWVQPTNTGGSSTTSISILATTAVTGATYAALATDYYIGVSYAGPVTITLPTNPETGREIVVKDESGNAGNGVNRQITIVGATASNKIDNQSSAIINLDNAGLHFIYRNGWRII